MSTIDAVIYGFNFFPQYDVNMKAFMTTQEVFYFFKEFVTLMRQDLGLDPTSYHDYMSGDYKSFKKFMFPELCEPEPEPELEDDDDDAWF